MNFLERYSLPDSVHHLLHIMNILLPLVPLLGESRLLAHSHSLTLVFLHSYLACASVSPIEDVLCELVQAD